QGDVKHYYNASSLPRWSAKPTQLFEIEARIEGVSYKYKLQIEHRIERKTCRVSEEELQCEAITLYKSKLGEAQLYRDDGSQGPNVLVDWSRSGLPGIQPRPDNEKLTKFKLWAEKAICVML